MLRQADRWHTESAGFLVEHLLADDAPVVTDGR
jgi:hypothetical protein